MKNNLYIIFSFFMVLFLSSCEEVVDVELEQSEPRLVIEASIIWLKGTTGMEQGIKLSETSPFYDEENNPVENAEVIITSDTGERFSFNHSEEGKFINNNFSPILKSTYNLEVIYKNQIYTASEQFIPVTTLDFIEQTETGGFSGDEIEIKAYYT
ncbi:MAG: DUF4249 domain-containing protein, partial [Gramella sp.]|nr:DUF4249 domain-containing protein [Christiangramia sp.]